MLAAVGEKQFIASHENYLISVFRGALQCVQFKRRTIETDSGRFAGTSGSVANLLFCVLERRVFKVKRYSQRDGKIGRTQNVGVHAFNSQDRVDVFHRLLGFDEPDEHDKVINLLR